MYSFEIKIVTIKILVIVVVLIMGACNSNPTNLRNNQKSSEYLLGELFAGISYVDGETEFIEIKNRYSRYDLALDFVTFSAFVIQEVRVTFNKLLIETDVMYELLENDKNIEWVSLEPRWTRNRIVIELSSDINKDTVDEFVLSYAEYEMEKLYYDRMGNSIYVSFNFEIIDEFSLKDILSNDSRVRNARIAYSLPNWAQGILVAHLYDHIRDDVLDEFVLSYAEYELKIVFQVLEVNYFQFSFNMDLVDEFDFLEMMMDDDRVIMAGFNEFDYPLTADIPHL